jgi:hypothetical protein
MIDAICSVPEPKFISHVICVCKDKPLKPVAEVDTVDEETVVEKKPKAKTVAAKPKTKVVAEVVVAKKPKAKVVAKEESEDMIPADEKSES